jgi:hypothetical protein
MPAIFFLRLPVMTQSALFHSLSKATDVSALASIVCPDIHSGIWVDS